MSEETVDLRADRAVANWYALYTCPRHEKCVARQIEQRSIPCFLPLYRSLRRWKDRRKELELALFALHWQLPPPQAAAAPTPPCRNWDCRIAFP
jgi:hypothetical protein